MNNINEAIELELMNSKKDLHHLSLINEDKVNNNWSIMIMLLKTLFIFITTSIATGYRILKIWNLKIKIFVLEIKIKNG